MQSTWRMADFGELLLQHQGDLFFMWSGNNVPPLGEGEAVEIVHADGDRFKTRVGGSGAKEWIRRGRDSDIVAWRPIKEVQVMADSTDEDTSKIDIELIANDLEKVARLAGRFNLTDQATEIGALVAKYREQAKAIEG